MNRHDLIIEYKAGDPIALVRPQTKEGRTFLIDNVKGRRINSNAVCKPQQLLDLIAKMGEANISASWRNK